MAGTALTLAVSLAACGGDGSPSTTPGGPTTTQEPAVTGPAVSEASPEATAGSAETGELSEEDEAAVAAAVRSYIRGLNSRDAAAVCALFEPGALQVRELPRRRGGCAASVEASLGHARPGGIP